MQNLLFKLKFEQSIYRYFLPLSYGDLIFISPYSDTTSAIKDAHIFLVQEDLFKTLYDCSTVVVNDFVREIVNSRTISIKAHNINPEKCNSKRTPLFFNNYDFKYRPWRRSTIDGEDGAKISFCITPRKEEHVYCNFYIRPTNKKFYDLKQLLLSPKDIAITRKIIEKRLFDLQEIIRNNPKLYGIL